MSRSSSSRIPVLAATAALWLVAVEARSQPAPGPEVWAIVAGVDDPGSPALPEGRSATRSSQEVLRWLRRAGWDPSHQLLLGDRGVTDPGRPAAPATLIRPTRANLDWAIEQWLLGPAGKRPKPGDVVVIFFAGASKCLADRRGNLVELRHIVVPSDPDPARPDAGGWSLESAVDRCVRARLRVVCWLATAPEGPADAPRPTGLEWLARLARWPGVTAWLAADGPPRDPSIDPGEVFTRALLTGLGEAGKGPGPNLAECLRDLHQNPRLARQGFRSMGGVPPSMTLRTAQPDQPARSRPELVLQAGHADRVTSMAFPADGRLIATASMDSTIRIWSAPDRMLLRTLAGPTVGATAMAITRDDRWLVVGDGRGALHVFDRADDFRGPIPIRGASPHAARIEQLAILPDGRHLVAVDARGIASLCDLSEIPISGLTLRPLGKPEDLVCRRIATGGRDPSIVAALGGDGKIHLLDASGSPSGSAPIDRPAAETIAVSPDGRLLAIGYQDGRVVIEAPSTGSREEIAGAARPSAEIPIHLFFSPDGRLAVTSAAGLKLIGPSTDGKRPIVDLLDRPIQNLAFSPAGDRLAACTTERHELIVWDLAGTGAPTRRIDDPTASAFHLGFSGDGRGLLVADNIGGLDYRPLEAAGAETAWSFPAHRGRVQQISASPDRRRLLFLDDQRPRNADDRSARNARIWDLPERTCRLLPGAYTAGAFLNGHRVALIPDSNAPAHPGRPIRLDLDRIDDGPTPFAETADGFRIPEGLPFGPVAVSPDGRFLAAAAAGTVDPLVCVWRTDTLALTHWIATETLEDPVLALAFSDDGKSLLTGGESPAARLWDLSAPGPAERKTPAFTFADKDVTSMITCLAIRPGHPGEIATGHRDGQVHYWTREGDRLKVEGLISRGFSTDVKALAFSADGKTLAAAGDGRRIWVVGLDRAPRRATLFDTRGFQHDEQINALIAWPTIEGAAPTPMLVSGSDDTTIRFWDLAARKLRGTFAAGSRGTGPEVLSAPEVDWVVYTPDSLFDASAEATKLVHYRRPSRSRPATGPSSTALAVGVSRREEAGQLDQLAETNTVYGLADRLMRGVDPAQQPGAAEAPPIAIAAARRENPKDPQALVTLALGSDRFGDVRLYHNDVPIPSGWQAGMPADRPIEVPVRLVGGTNRFYAMASVEGDYDSLSKVVELDYQAPMRRGRVHVLTLGVTGYEGRPLAYAIRDGEALGKILYRRGQDANGRLGLNRGLYDDQVTASKLNEVFREIAREVQDHPEDTVVVFLAGHTGVFRKQQFCLLLPNFDFSQEAPRPIAELAARDGGIAIGQQADVDPSWVLPYSLIELNLLKLKALNRLVIVDACQAESIDDDPRVREIRRLMERTSRRGRTSYLLAARRGEAALEANLLQHGLFTYALLRGLQANDRLGEAEKRVGALGLPPNADFDRDREVSTDELDAYARLALPKLAGLFREPVVRGGVVTAPPAAGANRGNPSVPAPDQKLRLQAAETSFPLVPLDEPPSPR